MKKQSKHTDGSAPQSVTDFIKLQSSRGAIQIGFTDQRVSPHAGLASLIGFLHWHRISALLTKVLPHCPISNNASRPADTALGFLIGILGGAKKLAQVAYLRADPVLTSMLEVQRLPSQPTLRIGRASCRERVEIWVGAAAAKKKSDGRGRGGM